MVCTATNGEVALNELRRHRIDVVLLDIEMPTMDGITALGHIRAEHRGVRVIMVSTLTRRNAEISLKALQLGASDYIAKPEAGLGGAEQFKRDLLAKVKALASQAGVPRQRPSRRRASTRRRSGPRRRRPGSWRSGPRRAGRRPCCGVFEDLKGAVSQPILLTQHMPATFTALLAEQLGRGRRAGRARRRATANRCSRDAATWLRAAGT